MIETRLRDVAEQSARAAMSGLWQGSGSAAEQRLTLSFDPPCPARLAPLAAPETATFALGGYFALGVVGVTRSHPVSVGRFQDESAHPGARVLLARSWEHVCF